VKAYMKKGSDPLDHPKNLIQDLKNIAWKYAGPVREERSLKEGLEQLRSLEKRIEKAHPVTLKDLFIKRDLENMSLTLKAVLKGSLLRRESRGSFFRKDFPDQDDQQWLKNTCYRFEKGDFQITYQLVKLSVDNSS
jgi:succinate dehydrogenase/fumarate reductase flavoprotein subunit